ncbi:hypothetical protein LLG46_02310 [bacterium]|nr:hypothetical protein [bacterium]
MGGSAAQGQSACGEVCSGGEVDIDVAAKSNKATMQERIDHIYEMLVDGYSTREIVRYSSENWNLSRRQTEKLIARANSLLEAESKQLKPIHLSKGIRRLEKQYHKADGADEIRNAIAAQAELNKLLKLYESPSEPEDESGVDNIIESIDSRIEDIWTGDEAEQCEEE